MHPFKVAWEVGRYIPVTSRFRLVKNVLEKRRFL